MSADVPATDDPVVAALREACEGEVTGAAPISELTTLKVGGPARVHVDAMRDDDLVAVGRVCAEHDLPWLIVGRGSNLLVADAGWHGIAVSLGRGFRGYEVDGELVTAGAAEPLPSLAVKLANEGFRGFAWAAAVPGSLGGGVRMNAGAHGGEMADHLVEAELFRLSSGSRETWPAANLGLRYRHSDLPSDAVVVAATLRLARGETEEVRAEISEIKQWRRDHQPINEPNCGSVFTNPEGDSAGRLIEAVGGKELRIGGAGVSALHANFIVTTPTATAADVRSLIRTLRQRVADESGIVLRPEVQMVGDFDDEGLEVRAPDGAADGRGG
ncbi:MAG: UDP-N-acetylmuramate dehydrogenase [Actinobacteria bacterium]|nr:UDP-N-acetylmuramate dehydrogenase [Actinomycetota bacterium]